MGDMKPQEIAQQLTIREYTQVCERVEKSYAQKFGIISIVRNDEAIVLVVELQDKTRHTLSF